MVDLLPCPFCGSHPESGNGFAATESTVFAWCSNENCYLSPVGRDERFFTVEEWNTRAPPSFPAWEINELAKERDALKAELEAARKQEPFCWVWQHENGSPARGLFADERSADIAWAHISKGKAIALYTSPVPAHQAEASALPEHPLRDSMSSHHRCYAEGWNNCRAGIISGEMPALAKWVKPTANAVAQEQMPDTVLMGDHFTHERMGARFYCSKVVRDERGNIELVELVDSADKIPSQRKKAEA